MFAQVYGTYLLKYRGAHEKKKLHNFVVILAAIKPLCVCVKGLTYDLTKINIKKSNILNRT